MFDVILHQPEIAPNTGNIIRLCANTGARLHLIKPLGFSLSEKAVRRAGMDYTDLAHLTVHENWSAALGPLGLLEGRRLFALSTRGTTPYHHPAFHPGDLFLFGSETRGLPDDLLRCLPPGHTLRIPMQANSRSMNLSNAVAVVVFEAWRQQGFGGGL
jgi:tRNA (cytidine/uridine-2'-O-)-methyltransferase